VTQLATSVITVPLRSERAAEVDLMHIESGLVSVFPCWKVTARYNGEEPLRYQHSNCGPLP